ncbi:unnamed protein product [Clavelina lepadiformis]|uniref:GDP-D-glucose phosphorylase 1 n=1 Tax=Clavelina lepadiformis TaxID=159417 RepID=A0ABP0FB27_CLALP
MMDFHYDSKDLRTSPVSWDSVNNGSLSRFDEILSTTWDAAVEQGLFQYTLQSCKYKVFKKDSMQLVAILNTERYFKKRKRVTVESMNAPFSNEQFNFTKVKLGEILFNLVPGGDTAAYNSSSNGSHKVIINVCPIDYGHILLAPDMQECLPQKMTLSSLLLMFDVIELSAHPGFRIGFNTLHAWASVNHLHYHAMYFNYPIFIDTHPATQHVKSHCYLLDNTPVPGFFFAIPMGLEKRTQVAKEIITIADNLHEIEVPFNVMITRNGEETRLAFFPRLSVKDRQFSLSFDLACVEVGGQYPIKVESEFDKLSFESIVQKMKEEALTEEKFKEIVTFVKQML